MAIKSIKISLNLLLLLIVAGAVQSCDNFSLYNEDSSAVVATVGEESLTEAMLIDMYSADIVDDTTTLRSDAINRWVISELKKITAQSALESGSISSVDIDRMVESYRESLLIHSLEAQYLQENLDTTFTAAQIKEYYNANPSAFRLAGPLVRAIVVRLPEGLRQSKSLSDRFLEGDEEQLLEFIDICAKNDYKVVDLRGSWVEFSTVLGHIPFRRTAFDDFLKMNRTYEVTDEEYKYLLRIEGYLPTGSQSPIERETETIKKILKNRRRADAVKQLDDSLLRSATESQLVIIDQGVNKE